MKFTLGLNKVFQSVAMLIQGLIWLSGSGILDENTKHTMVLVIAALQSATALAAHFKNPDGAPASEPYAK